MKRLLCALAATAMAVAAPVFAADVGVSVQVGEPGFYGRIDIGNFPQPQVVYPQPVVIQRVPADVVRQPLYLRVPPGHMKNWRKHCRKYDACGHPVYFVQDRWYNNEYVPRYRANREEGRGEHGGHGERNHDDRGEGHDHGHGQGKGHKGD